MHVDHVIKYLKQRLTIGLEEHKDRFLILGLIEEDSGYLFRTLLKSVSIEEALLLLRADDDDFKVSVIDLYIDDENGGWDEENNCPMETYVYTIEVATPAGVEAMRIFMAE